MGAAQKPLSPLKRWDAELFRAIKVIEAPTMPLYLPQKRRGYAFKQFVLRQWNDKSPKAGTKPAKVQG